MKPDLSAYERETGDRLVQPELGEKVDLLSRLKEIAHDFGLQLTVCCNPEVRIASGCSQSACNSFDWAAVFIRNCSITASSNRSLPVCIAPAVQRWISESTIPAFSVAVTVMALATNRLLHGISVLTTPRRVVSCVD